MKKALFIILILSKLFIGNVLAHTDHYKNIKSIEMEIFKDQKYIGYTNFKFKKEGKYFEVKSITDFKVKLMGINIFSIFSESLEKYEDDQLTYFKSETKQNDKRKFVELFFDTSKNEFNINGSSFKGFANKNNIVGNWWNHKLLQSESQISPLSGSIKPQTIEFIKRETIELYGEKIEVEKFKLKSKNPNTPKDKKLDFDVWYDKKRALIVKIAYKRLGDWEYRLKKVN